MAKKCKTRNQEKIKDSHAAVYFALFLAKQTFFRFSIQASRGFCSPPPPYFGYWKDLKGRVFCQSKLKFQDLLKGRLIVDYAPNRLISPGSGFYKL